jgi:hypothetical protein
MLPTTALIVHSPTAHAPVAEDGEDETQMSLLDMVLDENPFLNEGEKTLAKRTERVRFQVASKLNELKILSDRRVSDGLKRPTVLELIKLIREAMNSSDTNEIGLPQEEVKRWWDEMTEACRPASKATATVAHGALRGGGKSSRTMVTAELVAARRASMPPTLPGEFGERQTRYIDWGTNPLETVQFGQIDFDEVRFKELCVSDKAAARTMGTAAMKKVLAQCSDHIFEWANEAKVNMCEGKWPKGDSLRSWVLRPALPEGKDSQLTVKIAYSNAAKAFLVHATRLPRRTTASRKSTAFDPITEIAQPTALAEVVPSPEAGSPLPTPMLTTERRLISAVGTPASTVGIDPIPNSPDASAGSKRPRDMVAGILGMPTDSEAQRQRRSPVALKPTS